MTSRFILNLGLSATLKLHKIILMCEYNCIVESSFDGSLGFRLLLLHGNVFVCEFFDFCCIAKEMSN